MGMNKDLVCGVGALVVAVGYYLLADAIPRSLLSDDVGAAGLPKVYAVGLGLLSLILIARAAMARAAAMGPRSAEVRADTAMRAAQRTALLRAAGMLAIGVAYVVLVPYLGYVLSIALLIAATIYYQGGRVTRQAGVVAVGGAVFFWFMFVWLLRIAQPPGLWPDLF
jgi:putative tricarboxylic transport membrane protein